MTWIRSNFMINNFLKKQEKNKEENKKKGKNKKEKEDKSTTWVKNSRV